MFFLRFWGTRGSISCPGEKTVKFGGNTASLELRAGKDIYGIDLGTGVRAFGEHLLKNDLREGLETINFFLTHTHLDHIIGFPMFTPVYIPKIKLNFYAPCMINQASLKELLKTQLSYEFWPINLSEMAADLNFYHLRETTLNFANGLTVKTKYLNHPVTDLGYRFEYKGKSIALVYDTEPFFNQFGSHKHGQGRMNFFDKDASREAEITAGEENGKIIKFMEDADLVLYDAQYNEEQYLTEKLNWGHSTYECAITNSIIARVKTLVLYHHDPARNDAALTKVEEDFKKQYSSKINIIMAREGMKLEP
ncbi:MAG: MBL fold metallo-hydrolase [Spirochaetaceae bacterium]|jgi:phosphoribosyl 1,2-cyclic phosphodiesterase|nr:MBL fold metallo-hydrolase [Spirochaetaceae bacterium]